MKRQLNNYIAKFSESNFWKKSKSYLKPIGYKSMYSVLLLYYTYKRTETPYWAKHIVLGALGYLITPIDAMPDLTPILGYTDDIGVLSFGLITIACHINMDVRVQARKQMKSWFGTLDLQAINEVEKKL